MDCFEYGQNSETCTSKQISTPEAVSVKPVNLFYDSTLDISALKAKKIKIEK